MIRDGKQDCLSPKTLRTDDQWWYDFSKSDHTTGHHPQQRTVAKQFSIACMREKADEILAARESAQIDAAGDEW